jgi:hypothetical protein
MQDIKKDRLTAVESINADQLTAVTGGDGGAPPPPPSIKGKIGKGLGGLVFHEVFDKAVEYITRPPSPQFQAYRQYEMEARRSRLLSDAYRGGKGN